MDTFRVSKDHLTTLIAALEHYYVEIDLLSPEGQEEGETEKDAEGETFLTGLDPDLTEKVYKALVRVLHPDVGGSHEAFVRLQGWADRNRGER